MACDLISGNAAHKYSTITKPGQQQQHHGVTAEMQASASCSQLYSESSDNDVAY
jgi:hypothetical protein